MGDEDQERSEGGWRDNDANSEIVGSLVVFGGGKVADGGGREWIGGDWVGSERGGEGRKGRCGTG